jgi:pimeloyl-ACP methyl ester carboxylesterase
MPGGTGAPAATAPAVGTIKAGMPTDAATFELDKFLSQVAYAVYSDAQLIDDSNASLQKAQKQLALIENDTRRDEAMRAKEARDARAKIDALSQKLAEQQAQGDIKENVGQVFGARRLSYPSIESFAASKHIYFDSYATSDAKRVIVFRGTANKDDVLTDLKIGMTPELFTELANRTRAANGSPMLSGVSDLAVKNMAAGQFNADDTGLPEEFRAAEDIVARVMATGVRASDIVLSGHSLGGGYAQYAGMRKRVGQVVAFNPAPLSAALQKEALAGLGGSPIRMRHYISFVGMQGSDAGYFDPVSQLTSEYLKQPGMNALRVMGEQYVVRVCASAHGPEYQAFEQKAQDFISQKTAVGVDRAGGKFQAAGKVLGALAGAFAAKDLPKTWLILNAHKMKNLQESMQQGGKVSCSV